MSREGWGMKPRPVPYFGFRVLGLVIVTAALLGAISMAVNP